MKKKKAFVSLAGGALTGAANGMLGGGGGMLAVPLLQKAGLSARESHATAIAVILPASALSGAVYFFNGLTPASVLVPAAIGVAAGGLFGAKLLARVSPDKITFLFALFMFAAGLRSLF